MNQLGTLLKSLNIKHCDEQLLKQALTHRSVGHTNNERLEFVGDAVLGFIIADLLFQKYPGSSEGELSRMRASLVKKEALAELARQYQLGTFLHLGSGELKSGGYSRDSILADALEAIIGAVYYSSGYQATRDFLESLYKVPMDSMNSSAHEKDAKTRLQEWLQSRQLTLPQYEIISVEGAQHAQQFIIECQVKQLGKSVKAKGSSRRRAEQIAAQMMLDIINE